MPSGTVTTSTLLHLVVGLFFRLFFVTTPIPIVLGYLPNGIHAVEAMLAASSIGAIWSATSPDFGINASNYVFILQLS